MPIRLTIIDTLPKRQDDKSRIQTLTILHFVLIQITIDFDVVFSFQAEPSMSHGLSLEPNPLPVTSHRNEIDINYENLIENLLLQQVLLYTRE